MEILESIITITLPLIVLIFTTIIGVIRPLGKIEGRTEYIENEVKGTISKLIDGLTDVTKSVTDPRLIEAFKKGKSPLSTEQIKKRDELLQKGRNYGLNSYEVEELRQILEQGARESAAGSFFAFLGFLALISILLAALSKED